MGVFRFQVKSEISLPELVHWISFDTGLVENGEFVECLDYIHNVFFSDLETEMGDLIEALTSFEEKCT